MSEDKQPIRQAVKAFYGNKSLSAEQMKTLQNILSQHSEEGEQHQQSSGSRFKQINVYKWPGSIAASILLFVVMMGYFQTPDLISSAYADIQKDSNLNNGMQVSMQQWLDENDISRVPIMYPVEMSKFCRLDQKLTTHLRIAGKEQGVLNVFFHQGKRPLHWSPLHWLKGAGTLDDMNWKLVKVRDDLTVIVLYSHDMREKAVLHIMREMLPEFEV
ncbi:MAG: hypothetical protein DIZ80_05260 [endosymbiont of Galathealinum brachiosum]|uniref:DUF3379 domain-containing protein n=1 Tax=endosymbiont of Galathealinum brachiosum TaxID=2200906 RepID=A0A370DKG1_9GAMM|nr:MAG: hypothetical protein DIZ80_05260 [endosymbiont of Galathealinum brachiosum]